MHHPGRLAIHPMQLRSALRRSRVRRRDRSVLPAGFDRVLHHHVRKSAGTSLNAAFYAIAGYEYEEMRNRAAEARATGRLDTPPPRRNDLSLVFSGSRDLGDGAYFFCASHVPAHRFQLPSGTFRVTILRHPVRRLVSHYRYLRHLRELGIEDGPSPDELAWAAGSFGEFVAAMPRRHRDRQLFMFSESFSVDEAAAAITGLEAVLFTETYPADLAALATRLDLPLEVRRERSFAYTTVVSDAEAAAVAPLLEAEFELIEQVARQLGRDPRAILGPASST